MNIDLVPIASKVASAVAAACILGGGTMVLKNATELAVLQNQQAAHDGRLERMENKIDKILDYELTHHGVPNGTSK